jgi:hypothetical protein
MPNILISTQAIWIIIAMIAAAVLYWLTEEDDGEL